jgi:hypothetical protein
MNIAGCRREVVNDNTLRAWQLLAVRHHILRGRTAAAKDAEDEDAQAPDGNGTSLQRSE